MAGDNDRTPLASATISFTFDPTHFDDREGINEYLSEVCEAIQNYGTVASTKCCLPKRVIEAETFSFHY